MKFERSGTKHFLCLREAFPKVSREERRKKVMTEPQTAAQSLEGSALVTAYPHHRNENHQEKEDHGITIVKSQDTSKKIA